jgi:hypothetical protein
MLAYLSGKYISHAINEIIELSCAGNNYENNLNIIHGSCLTILQEKTILIHTARYISLTPGRMGG